METPIYFLIIAIVMLVVGFFAGKKIVHLKNKTDYSVLENKISETKLLLENSKNQLEQLKVENGEALQKSENRYQKRIEDISKERELIRNDKDSIKILLTKRNAELDNLKEKHAEQKKIVEELQIKFQKEFENLANTILEQKSEKFTALNKKNIENILTPFRERIKDFENKVEKSRGDSIKRHAELGKQIQQLNAQNLKISEEANNLTKALKGESKTQGNWGEKILGRVLEKSGLQEGREYYVQQALKNDQGRLVYPDVVIHLPNHKRMIIDSKVSLTAYERYINEDNEKLKRTHLKRHIVSLKNHIKELSEKKYEDLHKMESPDFVLMFVPLEPALYKAQDEDTSFFYTAFQKNILLVTPTTLLATLRTIDALWSNEKQQENVMKIANHAASLYHKFQSLLQNLETVGQRINSTKKAYDESMKKLTGQQNLIKDIDKLEELGISPKKKIDQKWRDRAHQLDNN